MGERSISNWSYCLYNNEEHESVKRYETGGKAMKTVAMVPIKLNSEARKRKESQTILRWETTGSVCS